MSRVATKKQKGFAKDYIETGNGTQAALEHYDLDKNAPVGSKDYQTAAAISSENLNKPKVQELINGYAEKATKNIQSLADTAENEAVKLNANKDQLDRAGYKAIERSVTVNVEVDTSPEIKELTKKLNELYKANPNNGNEIK